MIILFQNSSRFFHRLLFACIGQISTSLIHTPDLVAVLVHHFIMNDRAFALALQPAKAKYIDRIVGLRVMGRLRRGRLGRRLRGLAWFRDWLCFGDNRHF